MRRLFSTTATLLLCSGLFAQMDAGQTTGIAAGQDLSKKYNVITTAVSFLTITPDSRRCFI